MDIGTLDLNDTISGTRCYGDQQTEWATDLGESMLGYGQIIQDVLNGIGTIDFSELTNNTKNGLIGLLNSAMISLGTGSLFFVDNIPFNSFLLY